MASIALPDRIYAERDVETNEKRWYSCEGMGVEYVRADLFKEQRDSTPTDHAEMDIVEELRAVSRLAANEFDPRSVYACSTARGADEIERLRAAMGGGYDNAPTDPHHGGKIWKP